MKPGTRSLHLISLVCAWIAAGTPVGAGDGQIHRAGQIKGLTILIDFDDQPSLYTPAELNDFMNQEGYSGYGNNGSVRDYFLAISNGLLDYQNTVADTFYRATLPFSFYNSAEADFDDMGLLVRDALHWYEAQGFDFSGYDADGDGVIDALNVLTAGGGIRGAVRAHFSTEINVKLAGVTAGYYQVTGLRNSRPPLTTVCHENGHMLFGWPDVYAGAGDAAGDLGAFCLMADVYDDFSNPLLPNAYFRWQAGWLQVSELDGAGRTVGLDSDGHQAAILRHPDYDQTGECYVIENRQAVGRDATLPASGLAIYHVVGTGDELEIRLVEADGRRDLEEQRNNGEAGDLWAAPDVAGFDFRSVPSATWSDGQAAFFHLSNISASAPAMSFDYARYEPAQIAVTTFPAGLTPSWQLTSGAGFRYIGHDDEQVQMPAGFVYEVEFDELPYSQAPVPHRQFVAGDPAELPTLFTGQYVGACVPVTGSGLRVNDGASTVTILDIDDDGDDDIFVSSRSGPNRLLRNDDFFYVDIAPPILAAAGPTIAAAWADADNDGAWDVFLSSASGQNTILAQTGQDPLTFVDVTDRTPELAQAGRISAASWSDVNQNGVVDLFLARESLPNLLFWGRPFAPFSFSAGDAGYAEQGVAINGARWGDFDGDSYADLFLGAASDGLANVRLVRNASGQLSFPGNNRIFTEDHVIDAKWGDLNNDGRQDLILLRDYGDAIHLLLQDELGSFSFDLASVSVVDAKAIEVGDFDNNGRLDIFCDGAGAQDVIAFNTGPHPETGRTTFTLAPLGYDLNAGAGSAVAALDANRDGGLDLFVAKQGASDVILLNVLPDRGHWLAVALTGYATNAGAIGAQVHVTAGGVTQVREVQAGGGPGQGSPVLHFGLGAATTADLVRVVWSGTGPQTILARVPVDRRLNLVESGELSPAPDVPSFETQVAAAYPNPFNPRTQIAFSLAQRTRVAAAIYGLDGRRVRTLANEELAAGPHVLPWTGRDDAGRRVASGTYVFYLKAGGKSYTTKLVLVK